VIGSNAVRFSTGRDSSPPILQAFVRTGCPFRDASTGTGKGDRE
jgi:hypothetical protein